MIVRVAAALIGTAALGLVLNGDEILSFQTCAVFLIWFWSWFAVFDRFFRDRAHRRFTLSQNPNAPQYILDRVFAGVENGLMFLSKPWRSHRIHQN
jgi:cobalamin biosynthesis Mg chelatase CobN